MCIGVVEIHQAGNFVFQYVRDRLRDPLTKSLATTVGLLCFPNGLEEPTLVRKYRGFCILYHRDLAEQRS